MTKHRWEAAELVLARRCADGGVVCDPPAAGESSNDRRGRVLRLARLVAAPGAAAQAAGWDLLERRCREAGVRCSQQAVYPTAADRPGLTAIQRRRGKAVVVAAKKRTRKRLRTRAAALERLCAADEAADDGAGSLDLAYQLHVVPVAPRRPPGMSGDRDDSMSDSGEVALADRLGWDRGGWLCAPPSAPTPCFPRQRAARACCAVPYREPLHAPVCNTHTCCYALIYAPALRYTELHMLSCTVYTPLSLPAGGPSFGTPRRRRDVASARARRARRLRRDVHHATVQFQVNEYQSVLAQCDCYSKNNRTAGKYSSTVPHALQTLLVACNSIWVTGPEV